MHSPSGRYLIPLVLLGGCATHYAPGIAADPYGFFSGIWHGIVWPYALLANLLSWLASLFGLSILDSIQLVGKPNTGFWYYVGFAFGLSTYGGAASR